MCDLSYIFSHYDTVLTREIVATQTLALDVLKLVLITAKDILEVAKKAKSREMGVPANQPIMENDQELCLLGEGGLDGVLTPGKSVTFAALEVCLCVLVRHYPELSPRAANLSSAAALRARSGHHRSLQGHRYIENLPLKIFFREINFTKIFVKMISQKIKVCFSYRDLVNQAVDLLSRLPDLCSPSGALSILPSILWLLIGEYKLISTDQNSENYLSLILIFIKSKIRSHQVFKPRRRCKRLN